MRTLILAGLFTFAFAGVSFAQQRICAPYEKMAEVLGEKFREQSIGMGVAASGMRLEVFASPDGKTWTVVGIQGNGLACVLVDGVSWEQVARPFPQGVPSEGAP